MTMPILFVGHGSPMNAIENNAVHRAWRDIATRIPKPKAILCVSAHWEAHGVHAGASEKPETIHDFGGFPQALFDVHYPAAGSPALPRRAAELLKPEPAHFDETRGLDHGVWSALLAMYPDATIPVVQISLYMTKPSAFHYDLAGRLAPLRYESVLIMGSGNIVHNLQVFFTHGHCSTH